MKKKIPNLRTGDEMTQFSDYLGGTMSQEEEAKFEAALAEDEKMTAAFRQFREVVHEAEKLAASKDTPFSPARQRLESEGFFSQAPTVRHVQERGVPLLKKKYLAIIAGLLALVFASFWLGRVTVSNKPVAPVVLTDTVYILKTGIRRDTMILQPNQKTNPSSPALHFAALDSARLDTKNLLGAASGDACQEWVKFFKDDKNYPLALSSLKQQQGKGCVKTAAEHYAAGALYFHLRNKGGSVDEAVTYFETALRKYLGEGEVPQNLLRWLRLCYLLSGDTGKAEEFSKKYPLTDQ